MQPRRVAAGNQAMTREEMRLMVTQSYPSTGGLRWDGPCVPGSLNTRGKPLRTQPEPQPPARHPDHVDRRGSSTPWTRHHSEHGVDAPRARRQLGAVPPCSAESFSSVWCSLPCASPAWGLRGCAARQQRLPRRRAVRAGPAGRPGGWQSDTGPVECAGSGVGAVVPSNRSSLRHDPSQASGVVRPASRPRS